MFFQERDIIMILRDPIHGDMVFSQREVQVIDTFELQRLRGLRQLGTANLVYPGCVHTRFEHSLGTAATAKKILQALRWNGYQIDAELEEWITIAALLHDITHLPYGHTLEDEFGIYPRHDSKKRLQRVLTTGEVGQVLANLGVQGIILDLLISPDDAHNFPHWAREVISSTLDADVLDYLRRDAYFAGLAHDYDERVFSYFTIIDDSLGINLVKHGLDRLDARSEILHLLRFRYFMMERVYTHHTKIIAGAMIAKAVQLATVYGLTEEQLLSLNDFSLLDRLKEIARANQDLQISNLVKRFQSRKLLKRAYVLSTNQLDQGERLRLCNTLRAKRVIEGELAADLGLSPEEVIIYCPNRWVMKESAVLAKTSLGVHRLNEPQLNLFDVQLLEDQYENLWRFYLLVPPEYVQPAGRLSAEYFGFDNEFRVS